MKQSNRDTLFGWIKNEFSRYENFEDYIQIQDNSNPPARTRISMFTHDYSYSISCTEDSNYLGATASCRKPRAGETWHRGSDLPDGKFNRETWKKIKNAIISYELVRVMKKQKPMPDVIPD